MTQTMNRAQLAEQIAYYAALAAAAADAEATFRRELKNRAEIEYRAEGTAPTWRINGIGTVSATTSNDALAVADKEALLAWVKAHHPEHVEEVVRPAFVKHLTDTCTAHDDGLITTDKGDEVAGLKYVPGGQFKGISCRFDDGAKQAYAEVARDAIARVSLIPEPQEPAAAEPDRNALAAFLN